jgi:hypothetical protein
VLVRGETFTSATGRTRSRRLLDQLAHFVLALPPAPVLPVQLHESLRPVDGFLLRPDVEDRVPADDLLTGSKRPFARRDLASVQSHARTGRRRHEAGRVDQHTTPACCASSPSLAIAWNSSGGGGPTFACSADLIRVMNRMESVTFRLTVELTAAGCLVKNDNCRVARATSDGVCPIRYLNERVRCGWSK